MIFSSRYSRFLPIATAMLAGGAIASAQLSVDPPTGLSFTYQNGSSQPIEDFLKVSSSFPTTFTIDQTQVPWATIYQTTDGSTIGPGMGVTAPITLGVRINPAKVPVGANTYLGTIFLNASGSVGTGFPVPMQLVVLGALAGNLTVSPTSLTFNYQFGGPIPFPQALYISSSASSSIAFSLSATTSTGGHWLTAGSTSAFTPATATVSVIPAAGMAPGIYTGSVSVFPVAGGAPQVIPVSLVISSATGSLVVNPTSLSFSYQPGGAAPASQTVSVYSLTGGSLQYTVSASTSGGGNWLGVSSTSGITPSSFAVSVTRPPIAAGTYYGTINIYQSGATIPSSQVPVTLTVFSATQLVATPSALTYNYTSGGANPASQFVSVSSTGVPVTFNASVSGPAWITLSASTATTPTALAVNVIPPSGLAAGTYTASILLVPTAGGNAVSVSVAVNVTPANFISISQTSLSFNYKIGGVSPAPEIVLVSSSGASIRFDAIASAAWLKVSQSAQNTPGAVTVTANPQGLSAGTYSGSVSIVADAANNSPQNVSVTLTVTNAVTFTANPFGMSFAYQIGQADPPFQAGVISSQGTPANYALSTTTSSGGTWLIAAGGGATPGTIISAVIPNSLAAGSYSGSINVLPTDKTLQPLTVPVVLNVASVPVFQPSTNQLSFQYQVGGPNPQSQKITIKASADPAIIYYPTTTTADGGQWLAATPQAAVTPSDVTVTVNPSGLTAGTYYGVVILHDASGVAPAAYVPVSLQVGGTPILTVSGQLLTFNGTPLGAAAQVQQISVGGSGTTSQFHVDTSNSWLQVTPTDGTTDAVLNVTANPAALAAGYYVGLITISIPGAPTSQQYVPVVFIVR
jgi:hypothetical protein